MEALAEPFFAASAELFFVYAACEGPAAGVYGTQLLLKFTIRVSAREKLEGERKSSELEAEPRIQGVQKSMSIRK